MADATGVTAPGRLSGAVPDHHHGSNVNPAGPGQPVDAAGVTRAQWQHFLDFYRPIEDEVLRQAMQTDFSAEGDAAGVTAAAGVNSASGTLARNLSRSGATLTGEERAAVMRRTGSTLARAVGQAENTTRRGLSDSRTNLLASVVGIGRGVANTATSGLQSVADMGAQREVSYRQQRSSAHSTNLSAAATAASLLIAFI